MQGHSPAANPGAPAPLTGKKVNHSIYERPVMVMVENSRKARPQSGLIKADLVYEILAEGDVTRFVSVFHSDASAEKIGPVRSIRPYFAIIGDGLDALIVHAGWSQDAMNVITERNLDHFDEVYGDGKYYWRDRSRKAPHNLYTTIQKIREGANDKKMRMRWKNPELNFSAEGFGPQGTAFSSAKINYLNGYYVGYSAQEDKSVFAREMNGQPHRDKETDEQIKTENVLICFAKHATIDKVGRRSVDVMGPGKGYLLQNGKYLDITWENKNGAIRAYKNGKELNLLPGKTWIQFVPTTSSVQFS